MGLRATRQRNEGPGPGGLGLMLYELVFLRSAARDFHALPARHRHLFGEKLPYLLRTPFTSYPWLRVRPGPRHP